jgi:hypothetical protein
MEAEGFFETSVNLYKMLQKFVAMVSKSTEHFPLSGIFNIYDVSGSGTVPVIKCKERILLSWPFRRI